MEIVNGARKDLLQAGWLGGNGMFIGIPRSICEYPPRVFQLEGLDMSMIRTVRRSRAGNCIPRD